MKEKRELPSVAQGILNELVQSIKLEEIGNGRVGVGAVFYDSLNDDEFAIFFDTRRNYVKVYAITKYLNGFIRGNKKSVIKKLADHDSCWRDDWLYEANLLNAECTFLKDLIFDETKLLNVFEKISENLTEK